jgi:peptidylprolyl isomerase/peptidyl-prolyl cis-trans isomerase B (cyclophilin B)
MSLAPVVAALLLAVGGPSGPAGAQVPSTTPSPAGPAPAGPAKGARVVTHEAVITLDKGGEIRIRFYPEDAPKTVENFLTLARKGFYDGTTFHRVEAGFVAQGGDPQSRTLPPGDSRIGTGGPGYTIKAEFNRQKHVRGTVAMARSQHPDSAGSQFYICFKAAPFLDGQYAVFGQVVAGMEVVDGPKPGDRMKSVRIVEVKP